MNNQVGEILSRLVSDKSTADALFSVLNKADNVTSDSDKSTQNAPVLNEKQLVLQRKIDILTSLKALLGEEYSKKADVVINALNTAIIILGFRK